VNNTLAEDEINRLLDQSNNNSRDKIWLYQGFSVENESLSWCCSKRSSPVTAIIIQGPLGEISFFLKSLAFYAAFHEEHPKIIVTYLNADPIAIERLNTWIKEKPNFYLYMLSQPPHIDSNLQILSTLFGLHKAKNLGCNYALKTRSDMIFSSAHLIDILHTHLNAFCDYTPSSMAAKIVVGSMNSFIARPYCVSDFFSFGCIDDMLNMWTLRLSDGSGIQDSEPMISKYHSDESGTMSFPLLKSLEDTIIRVQSRRSEHYITSNLVRDNGFKYSNLISDYWGFVRSCLIIVDSPSLGICWPKYLNTTSDYKYRQGWAQISEYLQTEYRMKEWSFADWLHLYSTQCP